MQIDPQKFALGTLTTLLVDFFRSDFRIEMVDKGGPRIHVGSKHATPEILDEALRLLLTRYPEGALELSNDEKQSIVKHAGDILNAG